jgi:hypothetical protein
MKYLLLVLTAACIMQACGPGGKNPTVTYVSVLLDKTDNLREVSGLKAYQIENLYLMNANNNSAYVVRFTPITNLRNNPTYIVSRKGYEVLGGNEYEFRKNCLAFDKVMDSTLQRSRASRRE